MTRPAVNLTERRTREVRLHSAEVEFLRTRASHLVEIVPAFRRGFCRLTPRETVGWFDGPMRRFAIRSKFPWPTVLRLLGLTAPPGETELPGGDLLNAFAHAFTFSLRDVARGGLVCGYNDRDATAAFLRGKLRVADQFRDVAARAFPDRFHITESVLELDVPWNRIPRAVADELVDHPGLSLAARTEVQLAARALEGVPCTPPTGADWVAAETEPRAGHYRPLLDVCRVLHEGLAAARPAETGQGGFLIDLSRAFERHAGELLRGAFAARVGWSVELQPCFPVGPMTLEPDILIRRRGAPWAVLDAKWKAADLTSLPDVHQVLAYAAVTGVRLVGLVYPGRRWACRVCNVPDRGVCVAWIQIPVVGPADGCARAVKRLVWLVRKARSRLCGG